MTRLHRMAAMMAGVAGVTASLMLAAAPASADAGVNRYEGLSAEITGCSDDAVTIERKSIPHTGADIWLRYSPTAARSGPTSAARRRAARTTPAAPP